MKSGKSWGIRDIDDRTRATAEEAARQAGMTLEAWLREAVAERAAEAGIASEAETAARDLDDEDAGAIAAALASLGEQVRAMTAEVRTETDGEPGRREAAALVERLARELQDIDETARSTVEGLPRSAPSRRGGGSLEDAIRGLEAQIAAIAARSKPQPRRDPAYDDVRDRLAALLARAPEPAARASEPPRSSTADLERTLRDLEARLARAAGAARPAAAPTPRDEEDRIRRIKARLADISERVSELPPRTPPRVAPEPDPLTAAIADIARRQSALAGRAAVPAAGDASSASIGALRAEIVVLSDRVAALAERDRHAGADFDNLAGRIDALTAAERTTAGAVAAALDGFRGAVESLAASRGPSVDTAAIATLATGLAELRLRVEGLEKAGRDDSDVLRRMETRLDNIARFDPEGLVRGLDDRIESLAARLEAIVRAPAPTARMDEIRSEIAGIRTELKARAPQGTEALESQIRELAEQVAAAARAESDSGQLAAIEARVESLAADLARATPRAAALEQVEENLVRLQASLVEGRQESIEAARSAARNAVREFGATGGDRDLVAALRHDLDEIRRLIGAAERPGEASEASVRATLASVAERIGSIEQAVEPPPAAKPAPRPYVVPLAEPAIPRAEPRPRADLAAIRELAASTPADRRVAGHRADFIAAARRAAQAAVAEADAGTGAGIGDRAAAADPGHSPFARIGQAIRARRKPLLLAAAAIVLAIGALQMFSRPVEVTQLAPISPSPAAVIVHRPPAAAPAAAAPRAAVPRLDDTAMVSPATDPRSAMALAAPDTVVTGSTQAVATDAGMPEPLRRAAEAGNPVAAYEIGTRFAEGKGVARDLAQAAQWYQRAADAGLAPAEYRLGSLYERGQGVVRDEARAVALYRRAADQGNIGAMHNLAVLTSQGAAGVPDAKAALSWFVAAANYGVKDSQYNLGVVYARGLGTTENLPEAYKWFAIAAAAGDKDAAGRRDEVAALLNQDQLAIARATVKAWRPKMPPAAANTVTIPPGGWGSAAQGVTAADQTALVRKIQTLLAEQGYDPGPADGVAGAQTRDAVRAFQARAGLASTGRIDRSLVTALAGPTG